MIKRIGLGLLTALVIAIALDLVPSLLPETWARERLLGYFYVWLGVEAAYLTFLATLGGAYVARVPFVIPAIMFTVGTWMFMIYFLNSIAAVAGQGDILVVAGSNVPGLVFGIVGAVAGAHLGGRLSRRTEEAIADAA